MLRKSPKTRKFSPQQIESIRKMRAAGVSLLRLAKEYKVKHALIGLICMGKIYRDCPGPLTMGFNSCKKLDDDQISTIRTRKTAGESTRTLADEFSVTIMYIRQICRKIRRHPMARFNSYY